MTGDERPTEKELLQAQVERLYLKMVMRAYAAEKAAVRQADREEAMRDD